MDMTDVDAALGGLQMKIPVSPPDELGRTETRLHKLKHTISMQSKKNFALERDVRYLDSRIALLINHRVSYEEVAFSIDDHDQPLSTGSIKDDRKRQHYGNLFFLLQTNPRYLSTVSRLLTMGEIDSLLQTVMFTLFGNQYESREEHLLLSLFEHALQLEFDECKNLSNLMRANTSISRMMTTYTRRGPGQQYIKAVLSKQLNSLLDEIDGDLECNPLKVYEQMCNDIEVKTGADCNLPRGITTEEAAENKDVKDIIMPRIKRIMKIAQSFLDEMLSSISIVPYGIRYLCKQIRTLMAEKFPHAGPEKTTTLIGGFFLLRFVNPAVVTPQAYMLINDKPDVNVRRTLTLIAKLMQNLANKPNLAKEPHMKYFIPFFKENESRFSNFLNELCEVDDFYESLEMDQYIALTRTDISIGITLNEIFNMHGLLRRNLAVLSPNDEDHLKLILEDLGPEPAQLPRAENRSTQLQLFSRFEQDTTKQSGTGTKVLLNNVKHSLVSLARWLPTVNRNSVNSLINAATGHSNEHVHNIASQAEFFLKELMGNFDAAELMGQVEAELALLSKNQGKLQKELDSLQTVFANICAHNNFLLLQLDTYKVYLLNVRGQASANTTTLEVQKRGTKSKVKKSVSYKKNNNGPFRFNHTNLEKDGVIIESDVPENRRGNIYFNFTSPGPGTFIIALHYKGRDKAILEMNLKLDDLLEKQQDNVQTLDLEYVQLNVNKTLHLLNKTFITNT